jgi:hypothetical protein
VTTSVAPNSRACQGLPGLVPAHRDDPLGAEPAGCQHGEQADGAVTDDHDGLAGAGLGGDGAEPAGAEHVGGGEQARDQVVGGHPGGGDERAVGQRDPRVLGLRASRGRGLTVDAGRLVTGTADRAGVVGSEEAADNELPRLDGADVAADLLDDAGVLVTHRGRPVDVLDAAVGPQVRAADTGRGQADDRVGRLLDLRVRAVLDPDIAGRVQDRSSHGWLLRECWGGSVGVLAGCYPGPGRRCGTAGCHGR